SRWESDKRATHCKVSGAAHQAAWDLEGPARHIAESWVVPDGNTATCKTRPVMEKGITCVALDDSMWKIVAGILRRPGDAQPELRATANDPRQVRRLFGRLKHEGPVAACYE